MSYASCSGCAPAPAGVGLGAVGAAPQVAPPQNGDAAASWIASAWAWFVALGPLILDAMHNAAVATNEARMRGDATAEEQARAVVDALGSLYRLHGQVSNKVEEYGEYFGLGAVGAVPLALSAVFVAIAGVMWWIGHRYTYLSTLADGLRDGSLTPADLDAIGEAAPGTDILNLGGNLGGWLAIGVGLFLLYRWARDRSGYAGFGRNPDLFFVGNPDEGLIGERVYAISYRHADNSQPYFHDFGEGVEMIGDPDGTVRLRHPRKRLWRDF